MGRFGDRSNGDVTPGKRSAQSSIRKTVSTFDHAVIAVRDLNLAVETYRGLGFQCALGGRHSGRGTENAIIRFGADYLELITVYDEGLARSIGGNVHDLLKYLHVHSGGGLGFAINVLDLDALASAWTPDLPPVFGPFPMERVRSDGERFSWRLLVPGASAWRRPWPFFIQWDTPLNKRIGPDWPAHHPNGASGIAGVALVVRDVTEPLELYVRHLEFTIQHTAVDAPTVGAVRTRVALGGFHVDLLQPTGPGPARSALEREGEGLFQVDLKASDLALARAKSGAVNASDDSALVSPSAACGVRLMFCES